MKLAEAVNPPVPTLGGSAVDRPGSTGTTKADQNQMHRVSCLSRDRPNIPESKRLKIWVDFKTGGPAALAASFFTRCKRGVQAAGAGEQETVCGVFSFPPGMGQRGRLALDAPEDVRLSSIGASHQGILRKDVLEFYLAQPKRTLMTKPHPGALKDHSLSS
ncbi:hypothetical protein LFT45_19940 [Arthrobacter sp. FW305-BF8]|uniref:hypothetical protein n=1 Tax=Arthrobacter sp. FW305-BF8 TaxID=2879617 RepID=UPI001F384F38|nr:hypothetical protein [Arthrobacter sp. FW305-BF8]UKA53949.1 hypothetical protein LFT45_19940 [Arthrobacter sp. FW305-BF8]